MSDKMEWRDATVTIEAASDLRIVGKTDEEARQIARMDLKDQRIAELEEELAHWRDVERLQRRRYIQGAEMWWAGHPDDARRGMWPDLGALVTYLTGKAAQAAEREELVARLRVVARAAARVVIHWYERGYKLADYPHMLKVKMAVDALLPGDVGEDNDGA